MTAAICPTSRRWRRESDRNTDHVDRRRVSWAIGTVGREPGAVEGARAGPLWLRWAGGEAGAGLVAGWARQLCCGLSQARPEPVPPVSVAWLPHPARRPPGICVSALLPSPPGPGSRLPQASGTPSGTPSGTLSVPSCLPSPAVDARLSPQAQGNRCALREASPGTSRLKPARIPRLSPAGQSPRPRPPVARRGRVIISAGNCRPGHRGRLPRTFLSPQDSGAVRRRGQRQQGGRGRQRRVLLPSSPPQLGPSDSRRQTPPFGRPCSGDVREPGCRVNSPPGSSFVIVGIKIKSPGTPVAAIVPATET